MNLHHFSEKFSRKISETLSKLLLRDVGFYLQKLLLYYPTNSVNKKQEPFPSGWVHSARWRVWRFKSLDIYWWSPIREIVIMILWLLFIQNISPFLIGFDLHNHLADLIQDISHLYTLFRIDGIKATSGGISGGNKW